MTKSRLLLLGPLVLVAVACSSDEATTATTVVADSTSAPAATTGAIAATSSCQDTAASFVTKGSANPALADPVVAATCVDGNLVVTSNGMPDYTYIESSPGSPEAQDLTFTFPAATTTATATTAVPLLGALGVAVNGVPLYGPTEATGGDVLSLVGALSECGSHNGPTGFHIHLFGTSETTDCIFTPAQANDAPQLLGYAFDGYPIYTGNSFYASSWVLTNDSLFASDTWSAHSYVAGSGDLDECNGLTDANGNYAYYTTDAFPYIIGCYRGVVDLDASGGGGAGIGGGGPP